MNKIGQEFMGRMMMRMLGVMCMPVLFDGVFD